MLERFLVFLLGITVTASPAYADAAAAWAALRTGSAVALMRHADAPGVGDPPGFRLDDCATQRNLSDRGRADATAIGERLRAEGIRFARILSSPWCRCLHTAELLGLGPVEAEPAFSNLFVLRGSRNELVAGGRQAIAAWRGPGPLLVVTHGANIDALTGMSPESGEIVVVRADANGALAVIGRLSLAPPAAR